MPCDLTDASRHQHAADVRAESGVVAGAAGVAAGQQEAARHAWQPAGRDIAWSSLGASLCRWERNLQSCTSAWTNWPRIWNELVGHVLVLAIALDLIYQIIVFKGLRPFELLDITLALAFLPYLLLRGPFNRLAQAWLRHKRPSAAPR